MVFLKNKLIILLTTIFVSLSSLPSIADENADFSKVDRISGSNRYETAANVFKYGYEKDIVKHPVVVNGDSFADTISGGLLASEFNSPMFLIKKDAIPNITKNALNKIAINRKTYVIGGYSTISKNAENNLHLKTVRLGGKNRYETAVNVNEEIEDFRDLNSYGDNVATYNGLDFSDALVAIPFVYQYNKGKSVLLSFYPYIKNDLNPEPVSDLIFGGESSVPVGPNQKYRLAGSDRYKTAVEVAKGYKTILNKDISTVVVTSGEDFPDALCAGPLASKKDAAILLTNSKNLNKDTREYIKSNDNIKKIIIVGGEKSVSKNVENELKEIIQK